MDIKLQKKPWLVRHKYYVAGGLLFAALAVYTLVLQSSPARQRVSAESLGITEVVEAVTIAEGLDGSDYSNWETVQSAIDAVDWNLTFDRQAEVDAMAQEILDSIDGLEHALPPFIPFPPEQGGDPVEIYPSGDGGSSDDSGDDTLKVVAVAAAAVIAAILAIVLASTYRK